VALPIERPGKIICVGLNYRGHAREQGAEVPDTPILFAKWPTALIGAGEPIVLPAISSSVDYEAELGVVIGKGGRGISKADAYSHVLGYTIINDMTARDLQSEHKQWFLGKSLDTFCPMGPWLVTADELEPENLVVKCWINDELRQNANTSDLIFDIPTLIETISAGITLYPGDIIATGTPAGVGIGFNPPKFMKPGDRVTVEISGLGRLSNVLT
jgi:2-keto-4-pentenoate hydratase/2-oxohepta-3-ene-1,7-dioic acid hydratase in catechol pathway